MVEAFVLIQTEVGRAEVVAKQLAALPGVLSSEYVTGPYDVVVRIGADNARRPAGHRRPERPAGRRHHPHPDLPDRQRGAALEFGPWIPRPGDGPPRALLIAAVAVAVGAVVAILVVAVASAAPVRRAKRRDRLGARPRGRQRRLPRTVRCASRRTRRLASRAGSRTRARGRGGLAGEPGRRGCHPALWAGPARRVRHRQPTSGRRRRGLVSRSPIRAAAPGTRSTGRCTSH